MAIAEDADGIVEYGGERRYDRGDGRAGKLGRIGLMQAEDLREKDGVSVRRGSVLARAVKRAFLPS